ncbi:SecDF P1 head subdomain-containing protein [Actinophytocola sp. NPDC049390]|uniref:SecDF P1 head subdomain-containing protein n=1 Tax=Actinophytocola sp. NPDC049390 TaxID=3363894 RepID=UPI0037985931
MRSLVAVLLATMVLAGCVSREGGTPDGDGTTATTPAAGPVDLAVPIELRPVLETESADPTVIVLPTEDGERLTLAEPMLTIRRLDSAEVRFENNTWALILDLDDADGQTFGDWTAAHTGERLAMVADDEVIMAPQIQSAITGGEIQITGDYTQDEVQDLLDRITGR